MVIKSVGVKNGKIHENLKIRKEEQDSLHTGQLDSG